ncbi:MAG: FkbM family methyltransferase [Bacteroidota bacterium]
MILIKLKKIYKKIFRRMQLFFKLKSIFASGKEYDKYVSVFNIENRANEIIELRIKEAGEFPVFARTKSSDLLVLADTFLGRYHVPIDNINPVQTILDLGCNVGYTLRHYAYLFPDATLFGVEMDIDNYKMALNNNKHLPKCKIVNYAVWFEDTTVNYSGINEESFHITDSQGVPVEARTIDTLLNNFGITSIDLLKMDIEGAEEEIFRKNMDWMKHVKSMILEVHNSNLDVYFSKLGQEGFECQEHPKHWSSIWARRKQ